MKYHLDWLKQKLGKKEKLKFLFFWGHQTRKEGTIGKNCFSQWWESKFVIEGVDYKTAEHWMMAEKARLFKDYEKLELIIKCNSPAEAKKIGREVRNFELAVWEEKRYEIVKKGNFHKFSQHSTLKEYLLKTGERILVEASPHDRIWGIGLTSDNENSNNPSEWKGLNLLGFILMEVRDELTNLSQLDL